LNTNALVAAPPPADSVDAATALGWDLNNAQSRCRRCASLAHATIECPNVELYQPRRTPRMTCSKTPTSLDSSSSDYISNTSGSAAARKRSMWCVVVYVDVRWCMAVYGGVWWFMLICGGVCICVFVRCLLKICCKMTIVPFSQQQTQGTNKGETARRQISPKPQ